MWMGQVLQMRATIVQVNPLKYGEESLVIHINRVNGLLPYGFASIKADWWLRQIPTEIRQAHVGDTIIVQGMLVRPPKVDSKGVPVQSRLASAGIYYEFQGRAVAVVTAQNFFPRRILNLVHRGMNYVGSGSMADRDLLSSIVFGDVGTPTSTKQIFLQAGLLHVLAASGANVVLLENLFFLTVNPFFRLVRIPPMFSYMLNIFCTWLFVSLCGWQTSVIRAGLMMTYRQLGAATGRRVSLVQSLGVAGLLIVLWTPESLPLSGTLLSFVATYAVALSFLGPHSILRRGKADAWFVGRLFAGLSHVAGTLRTTILVELYVLPIVINTFHQLTPYSIIVNFLADPILILLLPAAALYILMCLLTLCLPFLLIFAKVLGIVVFMILDWFNTFVSFWAQAPKALITLQSVPGGWNVLYIVCLLSMTIWWTGGFTKRPYRPRDMGKDSGA